MRCFLLATLGACSFSSNAKIDAGTGTGDGDQLDAHLLIDAPLQLDAPPGVACYGSSWWQVCPITPPTVSTISLAGMIDTDAAACVPLAGPNATTVCALFYSSVKITGVTVVKGQKPLVLVALTGDITVMGAGSLDASSSHLGARGAGSDDLACTAGVAPTLPGEAGYGGSFGGKGGNGASSDGTPGGLAAPAATAIAGVRGGCAGAAGLPNDTANGGHGGGGIVLIASTEAKIDGSLIASGSGGLGGNHTNGGGGGGGSGGLIVIDAPTFSGGGGGRVVAAGGGGAEGMGNDGTGDRTGNFGDDPGDTLMVAKGGSMSSTAGGNGGNGNPVAVVDGTNGSAGSMGTMAPGGGGGGGGAAGVIVIKTATKTFGGSFEPAPQP